MIFSNSDSYLKVRTDRQLLDMSPPTKRSEIIVQEHKRSLIDPKYEFQLIDYHEMDIDYEYHVLANGVDENGQSISLLLKHFKPYFYVKLNEDQDQLKYHRRLESFILSFITQKFHYNPILASSLYGKIKFEFVSKKDIYGFNDSTLFKFTKITCPSLALFKCLKEALQRNDVSEFSQGLYLTNYQSMLKMMTDQEYLFCGWFRLAPSSFKVSNNKISQAMIQIEVGYRNLIKIDRNRIAPFLQASMDIETYSVDGSFPSASVPGNLVIQISTVFQIYSSPDFCLKHIIVLGDACDPIDENDPTIELQLVKDEKSLLIAWSNIINRMDPDIIYTYNGDKFDLSYIYDRAIMKLNSAEMTIFSSNLSRIKNTKITLNDNQIFRQQQNALNHYRRLIIPGRVTLDVLIHIEKNENLDSYSLDNVSKKYLNDKKVELTAGEMFKKFESKSPSDLKEIASYCIHDTVLVQKLVDKLLVFETLIEMSNITMIPLAFILSRGQQIKVFSQIIREANHFGFLCPDLSNMGDNDEKFQGAVVLVAKSGFYDSVSCLDFASLYPSIIMANNLCFSSLVMDEDKYGNLSDVVYNEFKWDEKIPIHRTCMAVVASTGNSCKNSAKPESRFCGVHKNNPYSGDDLRPEESYDLIKYSSKFAVTDDAIVPILLRKLYEKRKAVKRMMKTEKDPFVLSLLDKRQLAIKISMNSVYGFFAAHTLRAMKVASTVTAEGRRMLRASKLYAETDFMNLLPELSDFNFDLRVIYGDTDSIFINFILSEDDSNKFSKEEIIAEIMRLSKLCASNITKLFNRDPISLEFEKVYHPLLLFKKKKYTGALYEVPDKMKKIDSKGIVSKRRDNCPLIRKIYSEIQEILMTKGLKGVDESILAMKSSIEKVLKNEYPISDYIITKKLSGSYANPQSQAHVVLANRLKTEGFDMIYESGSRIPYVFVETKASERHSKDKIKPSDIIEHPINVIKKDLPIDAFFYIRRQFEKPLISLFLDIARDDVINFFNGIYSRYQLKLRVKESDFDKADE